LINPHDPRRCSTEPILCPKQQLRKPTRADDYINPPEKLEADEIEILASLIADGALQTTEIEIEMKMNDDDESSIIKKNKLSKITPYRIRFTHLESNFSHRFTHAIKKP
jgi:hypothetical protein